MGPDYDFGQGPMLFSDTGSNSDVSLVGAGGKSGIFWAFRAKDGKTIWSRQVSPGGVTGGMQWGSATDGMTIYTTAANAGPSRNGGGAGARPWTLANGTVTTAGGWAAIDAETGKVHWTTPDPEWVPVPPGHANGARAEGAETLANGVLFGCNMNGSMYTLNAKTGVVLWHRPADIGFGIYGPVPPPLHGGSVCLERHGLLGQRRRPRHDDRCERSANRRASVHVLRVRAVGMRVSRRDRASVTAAPLSCRRCVSVLSPMRQRSPVE